MKKFLYTVIAEVEVEANSRAKADLAAAGIKVVGSASGVETLPESKRHYRYHRQVRSVKLHFVQKML